MIKKTKEQGHCPITPGGEHDWYVNLRGRKGWTCQKCGLHVLHVTNPSGAWVDKDGK